MLFTLIPIANLPGSGLETKVKVIGGADPPFAKRIERTALIE